MVMAAINTPVKYDCIDSFQAAAVSKVHKSALLPYTPAQVYALVEDIEQYPRFLPWCSAARVLHREAAHTEAAIEMNFKGIKQSFTTLNMNHPPTRISLALKDGPFRQLSGQWQFKKLGDAGCKVSLDLRYEFASAPIQLLIGAAFDHVANTLLDAFVARAQQVYDTPSKAA
jgi:ribosome-associated toxin RatA of RatAB toxin-antitoxin module